jgi:hypothetical protein
MRSVLRFIVSSRRPPVAFQDEHHRASEAFDLTRCIEAILMIMRGGLGTVTGAALTRRNFGEALSSPGG